jgi:hypothetical protein
MLDEGEIEADHDGLTLLLTDMDILRDSDADSLETILGEGLGLILFDRDFDCDGLRLLLAETEILGDDD